MSLLEKLLAYYNVTFDKYSELISDKDLSNFSNGHSFDRMDEAVQLVKTAINNNEKILVYGDYDCDGIMGTSILCKMFQYVDYVVSYYIPNRYNDGYGITLEHAKEYVKNGFKLVITVDNGITAFEAINYLKENDVKVLVIDHHQKQEQMPNADVIIHPIYSNFGEVAASGGFTAFMFSIAFLSRIDKYLSILGGISLISDMMPLLDYNRNLLRAIFASYEVGEFFPIDLLSEHTKLDENVIGLKIAPQINSIGRLIDDESINKIVNFFISEDREFILNYYSYIVTMNEERKNLSKSVSEEPIDYHNEKAIIISGNYKEGIIGLVANTIVNKYHVPTIVFTKSGKDQLKGSARAPEGFDIVKAFSKLNELLITFGGHASAGGCTILEKDFDLFKNKFISLAESTPFEFVETPSIDINFNELTYENYQLVQSFSPFGENWPTPLFKIKRIKVSTLTFSRDTNHIITSIGHSLRLIGFNFPKSKVSEFDYIDLTGTLRKGSYNGYTYLEFLIKEIFPSNN